MMSLHSNRTVDKTQVYMYHVAPFHFCQLAATVRLYLEVERESLALELPGGQHLHLTWAAAECDVPAVSTAAHHWHPRYHSRSLRDIIWRQC